MATMTGGLAGATASPDWRQRLRSAGLRVTQSRLAVLEALRQDSHLPADQVADRVRERIGAVSTQAVYDALNTLTEHQILRKMEPAGSAMLFEVNAGDNHHHVICRQCGAIADVACVAGSMPCATPQQTHGFVVDDAEITFWGLCPGCSAEGSRRTVDNGAGQDRDAATS